MSLLKLPFLFTGFAASYAMLTPPQPQVPKEERLEDVAPFERFFSTTVRIHTAVLKVLMCGAPLLEMLVITADHVPSNPISKLVLRSLVHGPLSLTRRIHPSSVFFLAWAVGTWSGIVRYQCYRTLGRFFTFEVSIRDGHRIVSDGPYSIVRHPSYIAGALSCIGMGVMHAVRGSWLRECGVLQTGLGRAAAGTYAGLVVYVIVCMAWRATEEDHILKKQFGEEWEAYARRVRYRMIPHIF